MNDPYNPELEAAQMSVEQGGQSSELVIGGPELLETHAEVKEKLYALPEKIKTALDGLDPALAAAASERAHELQGVYTRQLNSLAEGSAASQGSVDADNVVVADGREQLSPDGIKNMVDDLSRFADELVMQVAHQQSEVKVIDMDVMTHGEPRVVAEFWFLLTGSKQIGKGGDIRVGSSVLSAIQEQGRDGAGTESHQFVLHPVETPAEEIKLEAADTAEVTDLNQVREAKRGPTREDGGRVDVAA